MFKFLVLLALIGATFGSLPFSRTRAQIQKFKDFLEKTRTEYGVRLPPSIPSDGIIWEHSGKYQGDILLDEEQVESMVEQYASGKNAYIWPNTRWPSGTVVYEFAAGHFDQSQINYILESIRVIEHFTCIRFRRRNSGEFNYVRITGNSNGCYANVGYWSTRGVHTMNIARDRIGSGCMHIVVIIHEWLHVIGFFHMQSLYNRDNFVRINWGNIERGMEHNFDKYGNDVVSTLGLPYEYDSCMHYGPFAFSFNGRTTIDALRSHSGVMGQMNYVTAYDFWRVDRHYSCEPWKTLNDYRPFNIRDLPGFISNSNHTRML